MMYTQWGVRSPWGTHSAPDRDEAETMIANMRKAGHEATLIWRGTTDWQTEDGLDD